MKLNYLTIFKDDKEMITMPIENITLESFLTNSFTPINPKETISHFRTYLSMVEDSLYRAANIAELKIERQRNQEKTALFSNLSEMGEFYNELGSRQRELCNLHREIGKIEAIIDLVITQNEESEESEKEPEWSIDWE